MTTKPIRHKKLLLLATALILLTILDLIPMFYQRLYGDGGTCVAYYQFGISSDSLMRILNAEFGGKNLQTETPYIKSILPDKNNSGFTYVQLYCAKTNEYIHIWARTHDSSKDTEIVFYGISNSSDFNQCRIINRDYDYLFRRLTTDKFERLVIDKLHKGVT